jgi:hypothetical protein
MLFQLEFKPCPVCGHKLTTWHLPPEERERYRAWQQDHHTDGTIHYWSRDPVFKTEFEQCRKYGMQIRYTDLIDLIEKPAEVVD